MILWIFNSYSGFSFSFGSDCDCAGLLVVDFLIVGLLNFGFDSLLT